ncbi:hypothetical protein ARAM_006082 [Aspergillus rambellii]|uniref:PLD phosphodiesterase domain-containing protein n=2 Tax=Aspergillus subgen. Nidulantes TaxID=2720870 RepID=A0A0F8WMY0_9EURO|nr:hypothetical protein ARAM_006082 [Aspergillus rambellii]KKK25408.1 hypothetical protein AOCH_006564 [Aspergillus ochraceoroseus]
MLALQCSELPTPPDFHFHPLVKLYSALVGILLATLIVSRKRSFSNHISIPCKMVSSRVYNLCQSDRTVSSELARDPTKVPHDVFRALFAKPGIQTDVEQVTVEADLEQDDNLERASQCGNWGTATPSKLFLQIYHDALCVLDKNPTGGAVSLPLMGSSGTVPLTIIAPLPDLCRHIANCIVRAEKEVFLGTNYWLYSNASTLITNALRELSQRASQRGTKIIVKILYDRGDPRQLFDNHLSVHQHKYMSEKVQLPAPADIPNIDLQVINFHRPILGTFHAKFVIIDRHVALLQSSNIQDNDNLEMMVRVEGPIVDSLYDTALISWGKALEPPFPMLNSPAAMASPPGVVTQASNIGDGVGDGEILLEHTTEDPHYDDSIRSETRRMNNLLSPRQGESPTQAVTRHLNTTIQPSTTGDAPDEDQQNRMQPYVVLPPHEPFPMALVNREPYGGNVDVPQDAAFLSAIKHAQRSIFIQTPNMNAEPFLKPLLDAVRRGVVVTCYLCLGYNDAGELLPFQNGTNEMIANRLYHSLETNEERSRLKIYNYVGKDQTRPIPNKYKKRSCHIKLMIIDEQVAIQGNGNLDTQSFFHSQEVNLLYDSSTICRIWLDAVNRNQNTAKYGLVSMKDGCWHDPKTGEIPEGSLGTDPGKFSWAKGAIGAVQRVRGVGGF